MNREMHRSSDPIDESSRLKQFAWEQWENQYIAVIFRPGPYGLERYVVKRYVEQVLSQSERWKQLASYFPKVSPSMRAYSMTTYEVELMRRVLDFHLSDKLHLRITQQNDQLIEYEDLIDFIHRAQELCGSNFNSSINMYSSNGKKISIPSIPSIRSSYNLPASAKPSNSPLSQSIPSKASPVKLPSPSTAVVPLPQSNKTQPTNVHHTYQSSNQSNSRLASTSQIKPNPSSSTDNNSTHPTSNQASLSIPSELCPIALYNAKIDGNGWVQINNVYLPFIIKNRQRLVPYQVLVSCKILENDELCSVLTYATLADVTLMNSMIRDCKINNEEILENAPLINIYHVLIGTKNLVYVKILPKDSPTSKINRQYKSVLALRGGSFYITYRMVPFVCSSTHSYVPLNEILNIYPNLQTQLKSLARVPRTNEVDYLQLIQMYHNEKELPSDTLIIDIEDLNQRQIIPSKNITLIEHHAREKNKLEQQIVLLNNSLRNKRKNSESHDNRQTQQKLKLSTPSNQFKQSNPSPSAFIRPPTGYIPLQQSSSSSPSSSFNPRYQQNHWLSSNNGQRGKTRLQ